MTKKYGGNVFKGLSRIPKDAVIPTVRDLAKNFFIPAGIKYAILGSAGKKETSGDIDIGVCPRSAIHLAVSIEKFLPKIKKKFFKGMNMLSIKYPIVYGNPRIEYDGGSWIRQKKWVQIDLMITDDLKYTKFGYARDKFATLLLSKISTIVLPFDTEEIDDGIGGYRLTNRFYFANSHGLVTGIKKQKYNTGTLAKKGVYSDKRALKDPKRIIDILFGPQAKESNLKTVESIQKFLHSGKARYCIFDLDSFPEITHVHYMHYTPTQIEKIDNYISNELYMS